MSIRENPHKFDSNGSNDIGIKAEDCFVRVVKKKGWKVKKSSDEEDMRSHIDYYVYNGKKKYSVDVKSMKRMHRHDDVQDEYLWIEFKNTVGNPGWLYGQCDLLAFETKDSFIVCPRKKVQKLAEELVDQTDFAGKSKWADYRVYRRPGRKDLIGMIKYEDLESISHMIWKK